MSHLLQLPISNQSNFIIVDEGVQATFAENLIITWLKKLQEMGVEHPIKFLLFSNPRYRLEKHLKTSNLKNFLIQDYFNIDLIKEDIDVYEHLTKYVNQNLNSIFILDCLSTLALQIGIPNACRFAEKLYHHHKLQVFCIFRRDFHQNIPRIKTLGNIYVRLKKSKKIAFESNFYYEVFVIQKKSGGSIVHWNELVQQNMENYNIETVKIPDKPFSYIKPEITKSLTTQPQSTFRMEMNEREIQQRNSVPLPYIKSTKPTKVSQIHYVPDDVDDMDDEDPDDDLDI